MQHCHDDVSTPFFFPNNIKHMSTTVMGFGILSPENRKWLFASMNQSLTVQPYPMVLVFIRVQLEPHTSLGVHNRLVAEWSQSQSKYRQNDDQIQIHTYGQFKELTWMFLKCWSETALVIMKFLFLTNPWKKESSETI